MAGSRVENCPSDIVSLPWLSHLTYGSGCDIVSLPEGFERLKSLHTLEGLHLDKSSAENIKVLGKLTNLRLLQIILEEFWELDGATTAIHMDALHSSISKLSSSLRILTLGAYISHIAISVDYILDVPRGWSSMTLFPDGSAIRELNLSGCRFERCPRWISQLSNLHKFTVIVREMADGLNLVSGLSSLAIFRLGICGVQLEEQKEESVVIPGCGAFKALKELIFRCPKAAVTIQPGTMPKLEKLVIWFRHEMTPKFLPVGIQHLPAPTLKGIWLCLEERSMEIKWKGLEDLDEQTKVLPEGIKPYNWNSYIQTKHDRNLKAMLKKAFKQHHRGADIYFYFVGGAHVRPDTRQLLQLIEEQKVSARLCIETEVPLNLMVDTSLHLAVGSEGQQVGHGEGFAVLESLQPSSTSQLALSLPSCLHLTLALAAPLYGSPPSANFSVGVNNDLLVQQGNMLVRDGDYYCSEQDDEAAYQGNGSQTSAQAQTITSQLAQLIEAQQDYGMMSTDIDVPPVVDTSLHLAVRSEGGQSGHGHIS